jgi:hypothetical protein
VLLDTPVKKGTLGCALYGEHVPERLFEAASAAFAWNLPGVVHIFVTVEMSQLVFQE